MFEGVSMDCQWLCIDILWFALMLNRGFAGFYVGFYKCSLDAYKCSANIHKSETGSHRLHIGFCVLRVGSTKTIYVIIEPT